MSFQAFSPGSFGEGVHTREEHSMNRISLLVLGAMSLVVASAAVAAAARLPISRVTVQILFVEPQSHKRDEFRDESFKTGAISNTWSERTDNIAKAQIKTVLFDDGHGLSPGMLIDMRYVVERSWRPDRAPSAPDVKAGETWTVSIFGRGTSFEARDWSKPRTDPEASSNVGGRQ